MLEGTSLAECDVFVLEAHLDHASVAAVSQAFTMSSGATSSTAGRIKGGTSTSASFDCDFMDVQGGVVVALIGCFSWVKKTSVKKRRREERRREEKRREEKRREEKRREEKKRRSEEK